MSQHFLLVGLSYRTAPISVRERLAIDDARAGEEATRLCDAAGLRECVVVSTCNRVEVMAVTEAPEASLRAVRGWFEAVAAPVAVSTHLYAHRDEAALAHLFRVAASLDSMVVGEPQILGQIKAAVGRAQEARALRATLGRCFERAFVAAKRVRNETGVATGVVSVSTVACDLAVNIFGSLAGRRVLLVGAGKMGQSAVRALGGAGADVVVMNRDRERAVRIAEASGGVPRGLVELGNELALADVVIASTAAHGFVVTQSLVKAAVHRRRHRPLFVIDISVPRNVDPAVGKLDNVFLYDVDDLQRVVDRNVAQRQQELAGAEAIVAQEVQAFLSWQRAQDVTPLIVGLRRTFERVVRQELSRGSHADELTPAVDAIVNKLLHQASTALKTEAGTAQGDALADAVKQLFAVDEANADANPESNVVSLSPRREKAR